MSEFPLIHYRLSALNPSSHYFEVRASFRGDLPQSLPIALPVWTPGSYLIREYARHLIDLSAKSRGEPLRVHRTDKAGWTISCPPAATEVEVTYRVYAYDLTVRTSYLDADYGLAAGAALFIYSKPWQSAPVTVDIEPPPGWDVATSLRPADQAGRFEAANFDELVDSPIQMGVLVRHAFDVADTSHEVVVGGPGIAPEGLPHPSFIQHLSRMIAAAHDLFGELPYDRYEFLVTVGETNGGGLEHAKSANIMVSRELWRSAEHYPLLLRLFAHEFFHAWNVKRLRPTQLGPFDYQSEVYTTLLWALEGFTDYFAEWLVAQIGAVPAIEILTHWAERFRDLDRLPGRHQTSLAEASQEAWIRQYRPDANTPNITISYYLKGALVACLLDLEMRRVTHRQHSLLDVMQNLWQRYQDRGYPENAFEDMLVELGGSPMQALIRRYVHGTEELDEGVFDTVGLRLKRDFEADNTEPPVWLGIEPEDRDNRLYARFVERGSAAERAGVAPGDELLAINRERIRDAAQWKRRLQAVPANSEVSVHLVHQGTLRETRVPAQAARPDRFRFVAVDNPTAEQREAFQAWLGLAYPFGSNGAQ
ncbi:MAG: PDZ domain-containing protein [Thermaerobacter sp.]|nr:PDZ domain-containing protein [Thermaerobacter sp.]